MVNKAFSILFFSMLTAEELLGKKAQRSELLTSRLQWKPFQISVIRICECEQKDFRRWRVWSCATTHLHEHLARVSSWFICGSRSETRSESSLSLPHAVTWGLSCVPGLLNKEPEVFSLAHFHPHCRALPVSWRLHMMQARRREPPGCQFSPSRSEPVWGSGSCRWCLFQRSLIPPLRDNCKNNQKVLIGVLTHLQIFF